MVYHQIRLQQWDTNLMAALEVDTAQSSSQAAIKTGKGFWNLE